MAPKAKTGKKNPRLLRRGDIVRIEGPDGQTVDEVVRGVDILVHLGNGADVVVSAELDVITLDESALDDELRAQLAAVSEEITAGEGD